MFDFMSWALFAEPMSLPIVATAGAVRLLPYTLHLKPYTWSSDQPPVTSL